jgi:hypothetical protein
LTLFIPRSTEEGPSFTLGDYLDNALFYHRPEQVITQSRALGINTHFTTMSSEHLPWDGSPLALLEFRAFNVQAAGPGQVDAAHTVLREAVQRAYNTAEHAGQPSKPGNVTVTFSEGSTNLPDSVMAPGGQLESIADWLARAALLALRHHEPLPEVTITGYDGLYRSRVPGRAGHDRAEELHGELGSLIRRRLRGLPDDVLASHGLTGEADIKRIVKNLLPDPRGMSGDTAQVIVSMRPLTAETDYGPGPSSQGWNQPTAGPSYGSGWNTQVRLMRSDPKSDILMQQILIRTLITLTPGTRQFRRVWLALASWRAGDALAGTATEGGLTLAGTAQEPETPQEISRTLDFGELLSADDRQRIDLLRAEAGSQDPGVAQGAKDGISQLTKEASEKIELVFAPLLADASLATTAHLTLTASVRDSAIATPAAGIAAQEMGHRIVLQIDGLEPFNLCP